ncbi:MAG TPA: hypothetical protein VE081_02175 [Sporichthyaceae bacterium]|nr:hypothetical protein [Sporichthyaceae bacterium]
MERSAREPRDCRAYLAVPCPDRDPQAYAMLEASLLELGLIRAPLGEAVAAAGRALGESGLALTNPWVLTGGLPEGRVGRAADTAALAAAEWVVVLDGWGEVPGVTDAAVLHAATRGLPCLTADELRAPAASRRRPAA